MSRVSELRDEAKALRTKGYSFKTKKARMRAFEQASEIEREAWTLLHDQLRTFGPHSVKATVKHFRPRDEHFLVETPYGSMWCSPTGDELTKSWYPHTCCIEYTEGQEIILEINPEVNHDGLFISLVPGRMYGGRVNETQYAELCQQNNLAFFKYPNGSMSGLFAPNKETREARLRGEK